LCGSRSWQTSRFLVERRAEYSFITAKISQPTDRPIPTYGVLSRVNPRTPEITNTIKAKHEHVLCRELGHGNLIEPEAKPYSLIRADEVFYVTSESAQSLGKRAGRSTRSLAAARAAVE
jgi:hypothetical protein